MSILKARQLTKVYGNKRLSQEVLSGIDLNVEAGEFIAIMGPSGSGKTTLLNVLSSVDYLSHGTIEINGQRIDKMSNRDLASFRKKEVGFIFQEYNVLHTLTVKENIMLPLSVHNLGKWEMLQRFDEITKVLGITDIVDKYPNEISGGQKQRTAAARAFINNPTIIFADEPTGALDSKNAQDLLMRMTEINAQRQTTIVMVTHDPVAASYSNRVIMLKDGRVHSEIFQGDDDKQTYYQEIIQTQSVLGGVTYDV